MSMTDDRFPSLLPNGVRWQNDGDHGPFIRTVFQAHPSQNYSFDQCIDLPRSKESQNIFQNQHLTVPEVYLQLLLEVTR